jgi:hypothetical protein
LPLPGAAAPAVAAELRSELETDYAAAADDVGHRLQEHMMCTAAAVVAAVAAAGGAVGPSHSHQLSFPPAYMDDA